jgi:hypothetical protein
VLCLALLLVLGSGSFYADVRVGNIGTFQLAGLAALLLVADRLRPGPRTSVVGGSILLAGLALLGLVKPNIAPVVAMLAVHLWLVHGTRVLVVAAAAAAACAAAAAAVASTNFDSWTIWSEWYGLVAGSNPAKMARPSGGGNYATSVLLSRWFGLGVWTGTIIVATALAVSVAAALAASGRGDAGRAVARLRRAAEQLFGDPHLAAAVGIVVTVALPPLVWYHYQVIALIPGLWLLSAPASSRLLRLCGLVALALSSGLLNVLFLPLGWRDAAIAAAGLSWVPVWVGILRRLSSHEGRRSEAAPSAPETHPERRAARRARRPAISRR